MQKQSNFLQVLLTVAIFTTVMSLGVLTTYLAKQGGILLFKAVTSDDALMAMSYSEIYVSLVGYFYLVYVILLLIPKSFIYKRTVLDRKKLRYDALVYILLPLMITLFLTEMPMTIGLALVATAVWAEVLGPFLRTWLTPREWKG